jgi:hypothetical protein
MWLNVHISNPLQLFLVEQLLYRSEMDYFTTTLELIFLLLLHIILYCSGNPEVFPDAPSPVVFQQSCSG